MGSASCSVHILLSPQSSVPIPAQSPILISPHPAHSPSLLSPHPAQSLILLSPCHAQSPTLCPAHACSSPLHPKVCHKHFLFANPEVAYGDASTASLTHSISQSRCDVCGMICRGLQASSKHPGRHFSSCCTAHQPCTCPPQQTQDSTSTRSRNRCLGRGAITGLGRSSHDASCCCEQSSASEVISVGDKGDRG